MFVYLARNCGKNGAARAAEVGAARRGAARRDTGTSRFYNLRAHAARDCDAKSFRGYVGEPGTVSRCFRGAFTVFSRCPRRGSKRDGGVVFHDLFSVFAAANAFQSAEDVFDVFFFGRGVVSAPARDSAERSFDVFRTSFVLHCILR